MLIILIENAIEMDATGNLMKALIREKCDAASFDTESAHLMLDPIFDGLNDKIEWDNEDSTEDILGHEIGLVNITESQELQEMRELLDEICPRPEVPSIIYESLSVSTWKRLGEFYCSFFNDLSKLEGSL